MPLNRREFLEACAATSAFAAAMRAGAKEEVAEPEPATFQAPDVKLDAIYEPDGEVHRWGTNTFGNWRGLAESRRLYGNDGNGYGIFLPHQPTPLEVVEDRDGVRARVEALLASGAIPVDTTPALVWD